MIRPHLLLSRILTFNAHKNLQTSRDRARFEHGACAANYLYTVVVHCGQGQWTLTNPNSLGRPEPIWTRMNL